MADGGRVAGADAAGECVAGRAQPADADGVPVASIWSWHDSMVTPQTSSRLERGRQRRADGVAHNALLDDPDVSREGGRGEIREACAARLPVNPLRELRERDLLGRELLLGRLLALLALRRGGIGEHVERGVEQDLRQSRRDRVAIRRRRCRAASRCAPACRRSPRPPGRPPAPATASARSRTSSSARSSACAPAAC